MIQEKNKGWQFLLTAEFNNLLLLAIALLLLFFSVSVVFISNNRVFDENVFAYISHYVTASLTHFFLFITFLGKHSFLIPAYLVLLAWFFFKRNKLFFIIVLVLSLSSLGLMLLLKNIIQRARPDNPLLEMVSGYSFPSGHALMSVVFYGVLIYIAWRFIQNLWLRWGIISLLLLLILLISFSRIYLRVHYATDVLAGLSVGFIWLIFSLWIIKKAEAVLASGKPANFKKSNN